MAFFTDEQIDKVAREMCILSGINPDEEVMVGGAAIDRIAQSDTRAVSTGALYSACKYQTWRYKAELALISALAVKEVDINLT